MWLVKCYVWYVAAPWKKFLSTGSAGQNEHPTIVVNKANGAEEE